MRKTQFIAFLGMALLLVLGACAPAASSSTSGSTLSPISDVLVSGVTDASAVISWKTGELNYSQVEYGKTTDYGLGTSLDDHLVDSHSASLSNLQQNTTYHFRVKLKDNLGNEAVSEDYTFTTQIFFETLLDIPLVKFPGYQSLWEDMEGRPVYHGEVYMRESSEERRTLILNGNEMIVEIYYALFPTVEEAAISFWQCRALFLTRCLVEGLGEQVVVEDLGIGDESYRLRIDGVPVTTVYFRMGNLRVFVNYNPYLIYPPKYSLIKREACWNSLRAGCVSRCVFNDAEIYARVVARELSGLSSH